MMQSYLKAQNIIVARYKIRSTLKEIDPVGTASRWSQSIRRRVYTVPSANSLWHMDAHLKLSRSLNFIYLFIYYILNSFSKIILHKTDGASSFTGA